MKNSWWTSDLGKIVYILSTTNFDYIVDKIKIDYSHRELFVRVKKDNSIISSIKIVKQGCDIFSSCIIATKLNAMVEIYHEGKTPGSVLCGPVYAHGCALLVFIRVYDTKKILVDALGTLRITGIHSL
jgi:hypothetical protein